MTNVKLDFSKRIICFWCKRNIKRFVPRWFLVFVGVISVPSYIKSQEKMSIISIKEESDVLKEKDNLPGFLDCEIRARSILMVEPNRF